MRFLALALLAFSPDLLATPQLALDPLTGEMAVMEAYSNSFVAISHRNTVEGGETRFHGYRFSEEPTLPVPGGAIRNDAFEYLNLSTAGYFDQDHFVAAGRLTTCLLCEQTIESRSYFPIFNSTRLVRILKHFERSVPVLFFPSRVRSAVPETRDIVALLDPTTSTNKDLPLALLPTGTLGKPEGILVAGKKGNRQSNDSVTADLFSTAPVYFVSQFDLAGAPNTWKALLPTVSSPFSEIQLSFPELFASAPLMQIDSLALGKSPEYLWAAGLATTGTGSTILFVDQLWSESDGKLVVLSRKARLLPQRAADRFGIALSPDGRSAVLSKRTARGEIEVFPFPTDNLGDLFEKPIEVTAEHSICQVAEMPPRVLVLRDHIAVLGSEMDRNTATAKIVYVPTTRGHQRRTIILPTPLPTTDLLSQNCSKNILQWKKPR